MSSLHGQKIDPKAITPKVTPTKTPESTMTRPPLDNSGDGNQKGGK